MTEIGIFAEFITGLMFGFEFVEENHYHLFVMNLFVVRIIIELPK